ncbi:hypothetical protein BC831DRAFT_225661 [Entophlyctis helioformis]|nr:hypothetical protein BC831DRAFT_225661 [Entophlyctis helioformis]
MLACHTCPLFRRPTQLHLPQIRLHLPQIQLLLVEACLPAHTPILRVSSSVSAPAHCWMIASRSAPSRHLPGHARQCDPDGVCEPSDVITAPLESTDVLSVSHCTNYWSVSRMAGLVADDELRHANRPRFESPLEYITITIVIASAIGAAVTTTQVGMRMLAGKRSVLITSQFCSGLFAIAVQILDVLGNYLVFVPVVKLFSNVFKGLGSFGFVVGQTYGMHVFLPPSPATKVFVDRVMKIHIIAHCTLAMPLYLDIFRVWPIGELIVEKWYYTTIGLWWLWFIITGCAHNVYVANHINKISKGILKLRISKSCQGKGDPDSSASSLSPDMSETETAGSRSMVAAQFGTRSHVKGAERQHSIVASSPGLRSDVTADSPASIAAAPVVADSPMGLFAARLSKRVTSIKEPQLRKYNAQLRLTFTAMALFVMVDIVSLVMFVLYLTIRTSTDPINVRRALSYAQLSESAGGFHVVAASFFYHNLVRLFKLSYGIGDERTGRSKPRLAVT